MRRNCAALAGMGPPRRLAWRPLAVLVALAGLAGCAAKRPVLYPNPHYEAVGTEVAEVDVDECLRIAEEQVGRESAGEKMAKGTAAGGGAGAAIGAAGGAVRGTAGRGAATGAAMGATGGLIRGIFRSREPDPIFRNYVQICLSERGYRVVGWR